MKTLHLVLIVFWNKGGARLICILLIYANMLSRRNVIVIIIFYSRELDTYRDMIP